MNDNSSRESTEQGRIQQAREIQNSLRNASRAEQPQLNAQSPLISRYEYNGNGLNAQPGTYLREGVEDGENI